MNIVKFKEWVFESDSIKTKEVYNNVVQGKCDCIYCVNFSSNTENIYPQEFKELLKNLGIDYRKESEVYHLGEFENGQHQYGGWFHFKGKIIAGKTCKINNAKNGSGEFQLTALTRNFQIGFHYDKALSFFESGEELVQVEFLVNSNWVVD